MQTMIQINHSEYQAKVKTMTDAELLYTMQDARAAIDAMPYGHKAGYYADEIHYCAAELRRRTNQGGK